MDLHGCRILILLGANRTATASDQPSCASCCCRHQHVTHCPPPRAIPFTPCLMHHIRLPPTISCQPAGTAGWCGPASYPLADADSTDVDGSGVLVKQLMSVQGNAAFGGWQSGTCHDGAVPVLPLPSAPEGRGADGVDAMA
jgi:hypothetical protein